MSCADDAVCTLKACPGSKLTVFKKSNAVFIRLTNATHIHTQTVYHHKSFSQLANKSKGNANAQCNACEWK
ncbi:hypothetical protein EGR_10621 [Echinococcus granulosus]|uniref:Uncharacterized protein n=1 Tax=Echinococcus granulosus TaxID=6210 RepID=W6U0A0_ECHGR|nr:hypothetical protein EGR_10621 [Echinococcus granulosus]EUB54525.1 hypothetical protein EGR_10621 [Echinococcus granulosus]